MDLVKSVMNQGFSVTDLIKCFREKPQSVTDEPQSFRDKVKSVAVWVGSVARRLNLVAQRLL